MFHWTEERVRCHVPVCFLALVLKSALQRRQRPKVFHALGQALRTYRDMFEQRIIQRSPTPQDIPVPSP